jgi:hypothetical protein
MSNSGLGVGVGALLTGKIFRHYNQLPFPWVFLFVLTVKYKVYSNERNMSIEEIKGKCVDSFVVVV